MMGTNNFEDPVAKNQYIPGVCNIGPVEIANRRNMGLVSLAIAVVLVIVLIAFDLPHILRILVFVPAAIAASALIQAQQHFCAGFGAAGLFNFGDELGKTDTVAQAEYRAKDKKKAIQITLIAVVIGAVVTALLFI